MKTAVLPLLRAVQPRIREFDGQRLPSDDWHTVRSIMLERDGHACTYCGSDKQLEGDQFWLGNRPGTWVPWAVMGTAYALGFLWRA